MRRINKLSASLQERLELPPELPPGSASLSVTAGRYAFIEGHKGIVEYSSEQLVISISGGKLVISGAGLILRAMNASELAVTGKIESARWQQYD